MTSQQPFLSRSASVLTRQRPCKSLPLFRLPSHEASLEWCVQICVILILPNTCWKHFRYWQCFHYFISVLFTLAITQSKHPQQQKCTTRAGDTSEQHCPWLKANAYTGNPHFSKVCITPLRFFGRPTLITVSANWMKSKEDFRFYGKNSKKWNSFCICWVARL